MVIQGFRHKLTHQFSKLCNRLESWCWNWAESIVAKVQFDQVDQFPEREMLHLVKKKIPTLRGINFEVLHFRR